MTDRQNELYEKHKDDSRDSQDDRVTCLDCKELFKRQHEDDQLCKECFDFDNFTNQAIK